MLQMKYVCVLQLVNHLTSLSEKWTQTFEEMGRSIFDPSEKWPTKHFN
jgi:hypothetical protein